ncbi:hypothetical protein H0S56_03500 [Acinetobacter lwoffii]|nr:hypothetical protein H0S56_03500 [Acinetobacter lwoffii]
MINFFKNALKMFLYLVFLPCTLFAICFIINLKIVDDQQHQKRLDDSVLADREQFPNLPDPIFYFSRHHGGDWGVWVMVYPLNDKTKQVFLKQWKYGEAKTVEHIECIQPTVKKRWKTWHSNIHYVVSDPWFKLPRQERVRDSFIVFGSEKQIETVEQACQEPMFKKIEKAKPYYNNYWAITEKQKLLLSVNGFY